ncbi:hypothetical protein [Phytoactinopolyspora halotolerans]|uniref:Swt1-like HEPN domain-containing protein n=1 Tax=Phytoactinopolyspora halotolerans TaxID=1981512 RepID=A0A6L9SIF1_9ACTN|nr:hypothetical protein [Phytoactinopolyspora halotolerans]NEE03840.1 hypothetical protein [Phytoactinopolyspora halotolerans]
MNEVDYSQWLESIFRKVRRFSVLFLQIGASSEPARRALRASNLTVISVAEYLVCESADAHRLIVIDELESMLRSSAEISMGALRERVLADVDSGCGVILLSRAPRVAFPPVPGSSLLDDASFGHAPLDGVTAPGQLPTCVIDGVAVDEVIRTALTELGPEVCASLDRVVYENLLVGKAALDQLDARELEALDGVGFTSIRNQKRSWNFPKYLKPLKESLDAVLAGHVEPQAQLAEIGSGLWQIERMIRRAVRQRAVAAWGDKWRSQCLNGALPRVVLERATDSAYYGAVSLKQLRDPLEWLTLSELLSLKDRKEIGDLGLKPAMWRHFATQIMPIRNRLAHMRMLRPEDSAEVAKWLRVLELKLFVEGA